MRSGKLCIVSGLVGAAMTAGVAIAADLPKSTQDMIKALKLDGKLVEGINEEVNAIPASIVEAAKKEGELVISGSIDNDEFRKMSEPFRTRYPFIKVRYNSADQFARNVRPLIAYKEGRVLADIIEGLGVNLSQYKKAGALQKLDDIPTVKKVPIEMRDDEGFFVGPRIRYWCMTYNTNKVKESELPKTWDDLLAAKHLHNGRIGMANRPNNFMIMLWGAKGPEWSNDFMTKLFNVVKPQLRKEGANAMVALVSAGEMDISFPTAAYRTAQYAAKGAPVSWHCPEPVPISSSAMVIMNKSPHANAAKLYINWFLSKEGQIAQHFSDGSPPVHMELQDERFLAYPKQILGRKGAIRTPKLLEEEMPKVAKIWEAHWLGAQGLKIATVKAKIDKVERRGAQIVFKAGNDTHTVGLSNSRSKITVKGKKAKRSDIKTGMNCTIIYPGNKQEAKALTCE